MKTNTPTPTGIGNQRTAPAKWSQRTLIGVGIALAIILTATPVIPLVLWTCFLYAGNFWQNNLEEGTIPEYRGVSLSLNGKNVDELAFGYYDSCPQDYFIMVDEIQKRVIDLKIEDAKRLGMVANLDPTFGDSSFDLGTVPHKSYVEFKNDRLIRLLARHDRFKFSKSPNGPFFSLPIAFDEYQKMFGKPIRWRREKSVRTVP